MPDSTSPLPNVQPHWGIPANVHGLDPTDLVQNLRRAAKLLTTPNPMYWLLLEAASEIERLRSVPRGTSQSAPAVAGGPNRDHLATPAGQGSQVTEGAT